MKLFELAATKPSKQAAKVFESYFGDTINVDVMSSKQARMMLGKVRKLVNEHKSTQAFHKSEQNPTYLKLMMMERVLTAKVKEDDAMGGATLATGQAGGANKSVATSTTSAANPVAATSNGGQAIDQKMIQKVQQTNPDAAKALQAASKGQAVTDKKQVQALASLALSESKWRRQIYSILRESEIQQAQVVLAAQDMVDQIQKMSEQVSSMQFKDLPALVDQVKNQVGVDQAMQFNTDATAALAGLLQNLQQSKQQMDAALATVTGQAAPAAGGLDDGMAGELGGEPDLGGDMGGDELGGDAMPGEEPDLGGLDDAEADSALPGGDLGRTKR